MSIRDLEKYSSAVTLSDMECFVYPELMYSLLLANIMSPQIWRWREESTFQKLEGKSSWRRLMRMRQYIMDEFEFNLDLNTWGLTHKDTELARFKDVISPEDIAHSNALFGYTGDKYYFDVDIRRHFGLDQYDGDIIPYWKTETVEAMNAFRLKVGYKTGAGECVSLSSLYAAAAFIICGIPLEDIYLVLTPLHSQNLLDIQDGVITNNRRLVTKSMWFNGTEISDKAQRALRNEQVTIVGHNTGWIHCFYDTATIDPQAYEHLTRRLGEYLKTELNALNFSNFLRLHSRYQKHFQFCRHRRGERMFVKAETLYGYEHGSRFRVYDNTFEKLLDEVSSEDYCRYNISERMCCEQLMAFIEYERLDIQMQKDRYKLAQYLAPFASDSETLVDDLWDFLHIDPRLPDTEKKYETVEPIRIDPDWDRQQIIEYLQSMRQKNITADLAFYAYRDMTRCDWTPFAVAAIQRCPVSIEKAEFQDSPQKVFQWINQMPNESIYDGTRLAQPEEVVNYSTGDGIEKAFLLTNILLNRQPDQTITISIKGDQVVVDAGESFAFQTSKNLTKELSIGPEGIQVEGEQWT